MRAQAARARPAPGRPHRRGVAARRSASPSAAASTALVCSAVLMHVSPDALPASLAALVRRAASRAARLLMALPEMQPRLLVDGHDPDGRAVRQPRARARRSVCWRALGFALRAARRDRRRRSTDTRWRVLLFARQSPGARRQRTRRDSSARRSPPRPPRAMPHDRLVACATAPITSGPTRKPSEPSVITAASATPPSRAPAAYTQGDTVATPMPNSAEAHQRGRDAADQQRRGQAQARQQRAAEQQPARAPAHARAIAEPARHQHRALQARDAQRRDLLRRAGALLQVQRRPVDHRALDDHARGTPSRRSAARRRAAARTSACRRRSAVASAMRPARGSSTAASTTSAAMAKCSGTEVVTVVMADAKNAPAIVPRLNTACSRDITGCRGGALHLDALRVHRDVHRAGQHAVDAHHGAGAAPSSAPARTRPGRCASSPPDSRLAPREPSLCSAAAVTGNEKIAPSAANSSTTLTCDGAQAQVGLDGRQARRPRAVAEAQRAEQRGDGQLAAAGWRRRRRARRRLEGGGSGHGKKGRMDASGEGAGKAIRKRFQARFNVIAPSGQALTHRPQPWHWSARTASACSAAVHPPLERARASSGRAARRVRARRTTKTSYGHSATQAALPSQRLGSMTGAKRPAGCLQSGRNAACGRPLVAVDRERSQDCRAGAWPRGPCEPAAQNKTHARGRAFVKHRAGPDRRPAVMHQAGGRVGLLAAGRAHRLGAAQQLACLQLGTGTMLAAQEARHRGGAKGASGCERGSCGLGAIAQAVGTEGGLDFLLRHRVMILPG